MEEISETVDPESARELLGGGAARAIDLREAEAFREGHPPGATAVSAADGLEQAVQQALEHRELPLLVFCEDGERSSEVAAGLRESDRQAAAVEGGWSAWVSAGLPIQPSAE
jgi:rhodanese-related sulfurtransferase